MIKALGITINGIGRWIGKTFDFSDVIGACGLGMVFHGVYQWQPYMAFIIVGGIVFLLSAIVSIKG